MASQAPNSPLHIWWMATRPKTLPAAVAPVFVGSALAKHLGSWHPLTFAITILGALFIQIGTNLANDYSDARRGADNADRIGPLRVTAGGLVPPKQVLLATYISFGLATSCGIYLTAISSWELLLVGIASITAGVLYTGGPKPYGYEGLGEVFVFLFFGIAAVSGSAFVQLNRWPWDAFALAIPVGFLATAILIVNNIRDIETDRRVAKRTLAVRLGQHKAKNLYAIVVISAYIAILEIWLTSTLPAAIMLAWVTLPFAALLIISVRQHHDGPTLNSALAKTAFLQIGFCTLLAVGILL